MAWEPGQHVHDRYLIERKLGEGGFGITYLAQNPQGELKVIKTLKDKVLNNPTKYPQEREKLLQNFRKEAAILIECRHPNIVLAESFFEEDGLPCIVMEYIKGGSLSEQMYQQGGISEAQTLLYIQQVGEALTFVHNRGLLHRDIKPGNIVLRADGTEAILIDFGLAREFDRIKPQEHTALGTLSYAPLEQVGYYPKVLPGQYTDVYALGECLDFCVSL
jgi:serine/threonine protein kinase